MQNCNGLYLSREASFAKRGRVSNVGKLDTRYSLGSTNGVLLLG